MPLRAIQNRSLADQVFEQLSWRGSWQAATCPRVAPSRRAIPGGSVRRQSTRRARGAQTAGANRAIEDFAGRRDQGFGLQTARRPRFAGPHGGTRPRGREVAGVWLAVLEMRAAIAADVARLCALRATDNAIRKRADRHRDRQTCAMPPRRSASFSSRSTLWERAVLGADNLAYQPRLQQSHQRLFTHSDTWPKSGRPTNFVATVFGRRSPKR